MSDDIVTPDAVPSPKPAAPPTPDSEEGRLRDALLGRYRVERLIGRGQFSSVFRGEGIADRDAVAIKLLHLDAVADAELVRRLDGEVRAVAALRDDGLVSAPAVEVHGGTAYLVMPFMRRGSLADLLRASGPLPLSRIEEIVLAVATVLDRLHARGLVHRDLTPENILISDSGTPLLTDCGITDTLLVHGAARGPAHGVRAGRARAYAAPEQRRAKKVDGRADQYALAVIAYEMVTGHRRLDGEVVEGIHTLSPIEVLADAPLRKGVPLHVNAALRRALSAGAENRFPTVTAFAEAFAGRRHDEPVGLPTAHLSLRFRRRVRIAKTLGALVLIAAVATLADPQLLASARAGWRRIAVHLPFTGTGVGITVDPGGVLPAAAPGAPARGGGTRTPPEGGGTAAPSVSRTPPASAGGADQAPAQPAPPARSVDIRVGSPVIAAAAPRTGRSPDPAVPSGAAVVRSTQSWVRRMLARFTGDAPSGVAHIQVAVDRGAPLVTIDGIPRGTAPLTASVTPGHHTVSVHGTVDYLSSTTGVDVTAGATASVSFRSARKP